MAAARGRRDHGSVPHCPGWPRATSHLTASSKRASTSAVSAAEPLRMRTVATASHGIVRRRS
jgi:hypothetical protein